MLTALFAAFLGGIILNLMPCVFPVISLKALGLINHQSDSGHARREGMGFLVGVVVTMLLLAGILLAARAGGAAVGWGFQLQSPLVIALLALVMLAAALNLLGLFEVGLAVQNVGAVQTARGIFARSALTGALAIIVATPCAAPFMASAIGYALVQPPFVALWVFFSLALGFAAPFSLICFFPKLSRWLPKPGAWMQTLKHGLAFPMLGAYAWLVWVFSQQTDSQALGMLLAVSVLFGFTAWLYGIVQRRRMMSRSYRGLAAITLLLLVAVIAPVVGITPKQSQVSAAASVSEETWSPHNVAQLLGKGKPIFVDFTASWCITCQVNQRTTLSTEAVKQAISATGTHFMVADSTKFNPDVEDALTEFGQGGLPMYLVYPADGGKPVVLPQVLTPQIVTQALQKAANGA
ncbi:protein-disulfide reductase DsbD family protein [Rosenbergiella nectarea]|uniref:protein-disulfide reductase DsbD family protein n=1 Tax=Rosenbergiella nectarea TaxID=988801 RepID=UPI001BD96866|nr:thioredoxin family protein [Rosenbergiella nectarea]MBT0730207.1 cytochrome C biogenesis protein [Rosenbergiella nectarea subsp. apis]